MNARDRRAIFLGSAAVGGIALAWLVVLPWLGDWSGTRQRIDDARLRMEELERQTQLLTSTNRQLQAVYGQAVSRPLADLATARRELIKNVMGLHAQADVAVDTLTPEADRPLSDVPGIVRLSVMVRGACRPSQLIQLLGQARSSPALLALDRIEATHNPQQPGSLSVTLVWFTLARAEEVR